MSHDGEIDAEDSLNRGVAIIDTELRAYEQKVKGSDKEPGRMLTGYEAGVVAEYVRVLRGVVQDRVEDLDGDLANMTREELLERVQSFLKPKAGTGPQGWGEHPKAGT